MHENWQFNTTTAQKVAIYQSVSKVVQSMRDIAPNSGAYFVSWPRTLLEDQFDVLHRTRAMFMKLTMNVRTQCEYS
jgi:hypothetical protein